MVSIHTVQKYDCDVLVVGGGPAGSAIATYLAQQGISTIVLEAGTFPRDKICGDAVSPVALAELHKLGITDSEDFSRYNEIKDVALFVGDENITIALPKTKDLPFQGRVIPRMELDEWVYKVAKKAGATFFEDTRLSNYTIQDEGVSAEIKKGKNAMLLRAKMLVGADGSNSTVARILHGGKPLEGYQLLGLRAYYEGVNGPTDRCDIFFTEDNFPGLFWFFPTGPNTANIGSAMIAKTLPKNETHVNELLKNQIQGNRNLSARIGDGKLVGKIQGWPLTFSNPKNNIIDNRLLLVGDAAGLINPLSGDGIQYALLSARWAAESLAECVRKNDFSVEGLSSYKKTIDQELAYDSALSNLLIQITRNRTLTPIWMEILKILFERAKTDQNYADIIAGIFSGTYPSYKALDPAFLLKSVLQGGIHIGLNTATGVLKGPAFWAQKGKDTGLFTAEILRSIKDDPKGFVQWIDGVARKGLDVSGHIIKSLR